MNPRIPLFLIAEFFPTRHVFRAFDHLIAAGAGEILLAPIVVVEGDLRGVIDRCPVPWEEVWAILDTPLDTSVPVDFASTANFWPRLAALRDTGWQYDTIAIGNSVAVQKNIERMTHVSGLRFARIKTNERTER